MLEIKNLNKTYNSGFILDDISLQINKGDFLLLFGSDDAGKTALLYQVLGLHHFYKGQILYEGKSIKKLSVEERKSIRFVPDSVCVEDITARAYFAALSKAYPEYQEEDAVDMCEYFGVDIDAKLTDMTYNENKLAMIIAAVVTMPKLLILDEPLNFLTKESGKKLLDFLRYLSSRGVAIIITAEESKDVWEYTSRYACMSEGRIIAEGLTADYYGMQKAVTLPVTELAGAKLLFGEPIVKGSVRWTFLYNKKEQTKSLEDILKTLKVSDIEIENLTLEEMLEKDYTRWM